MRLYYISFEKGHAQFMRTTNAHAELFKKYMEDGWIRVDAVEYYFLKIAQWFK